MVLRARLFITTLSLGALGAAGVLCACSDDQGSGSEPTRDAPKGGSTTGGSAEPTCTPGANPGEHQAPEFSMNLSGQTSWFAAPIVVDLDGDGSKELIASYYSVFVYDERGALLEELEGGEGRIYAPHVVADLEGDGTTEIVYGSGSEVYAYEWRDGAGLLKDGWPASIDSAGTGPEVRGMAAGDLNGDGSLEIAVSTTETASEEDGGSQLWVFNASGSVYQPPGLGYDAWPRYNAERGEGNDADRNGQGHHGYGCYGLNVAIGNLDDDPELEIVATYDNHHLQVFDHDGVALQASPWFSNRASEFQGEGLTYGQFIRWADPEVEEAHYHEHTGEWPHPSWAEWLQWTHSPPGVVDLDGDGKSEIVGVPNVELHEPYETQAYAIMVLEGAHGDGSRAAMRKQGWETLPRGRAPIDVDGYYPPAGVPAVTIANVQGDSRPELLVSLNDGLFYAFAADARELWRYDYTDGRPIVFASEATVADLNQDGAPEVLFTTFGDPEVLDSGRLIILAGDGTELFSVPLPDPGENGNGNGAPAAPTVADLDGDGQLEIFVQTFEHGMDVFTVPGSSDNCLLWSTARGGPLRMGQPSQ